MMKSLHLIPAALGFLGLGALGLLVGPGARAGEPVAAPQGPATWIYDVRVVRVDPVDSAVVEVSPPWQPAGTAGASTTATWAELLAGVKGRGRATIMLDQRLTAISSAQTLFEQTRKRAALALQSRSGSSENWNTTVVETGARGELQSLSDGLQYRIDVRWEDVPPADGTAPLDLRSAEWKGSCPNFKAGETLVLSHRQQQSAEAATTKGLEMYVFVTGWSVPAK